MMMNLSSSNTNNTSKKALLFFSAAVLIVIINCTSTILFVDAQVTIRSIQCRDCIMNAASTATSQVACANTTMTENQLVAVPNRQNRFMSVACSTSATEKCAQIAMSTDGQTCSTFYSTASFKCGGCNKWGPKWYKMMCPTDMSQAVTAQWNVCDDSQCSQNCVLGDHVYNLDSCIPLFHSQRNNGIQVYGRLTEIIPCTSVTVSVFNASTAAPANLVEVEVVGQDRCSSLGQMTCSNQPTLPMVNGPQALISDYANHGTCSGAVSYTSMNSGSCRWRSPTLSETVTCGAGQGTCANLIGISNFRGHVRQNRFSPACNKCQKMPWGTGYEWISCDPNTHAVTFTHGCDSACTPASCNSSSSTTYPFDVKTSAPFKGMQLINLGTYQCNFVRRSAFRSSNCNSSTLMEDLYLGENMCSWGHLATCGTFQLQEVKLGGCITDQPATKLSLTSGQCSVNNINLFNTSSVGIQATCAGSQQKCGVFHFWNHNSTITSLITQRTFVCETCYYDHRWNMNMQVGPFFVSCPTATSITLTASNSPTDYTCQNLNQNKVFAYNLFSPNKMDISLGVNLNASRLPTLMNAGITRCNSARIDMVNLTGTASSSTTGPLACNTMNAQSTAKMYGGSLGEAGCDVTCTNPPRPATNPELGYDALVHMCHHHHGHWECDTHRHPTGVCAPFAAEHARSSWSMQVSCGNQGLCANILVFNSSANNNNCQSYTAAGSSGMQGMYSHWNVVCGTCEQHWRSGWTYVSCDYASNNITVYSNCSANCQDWRMPGKCGSRMNIGWQECSQSPTDTKHSFRSLGIQSCNVVHAQYYNNSMCQGTPNWDVTVQEATRSDVGGAEFTCVPRDTTFNLPGGLVNYSSCHWSQSDKNALTLTPNIAQATCVKDLRTTGTASMINCHATRIDTCVSFSVFKSPTCAQQWDSIVNVPCNSCFKAPDGTYAIAQCGSSNTGGRPGRSTVSVDGLNSITLMTNCDMGCANCQDSVSNEVLNQCAPWGSHQSTYYAQFTQVRQCSTAAYQEWNNADCSGVPAMTTYIEQGVCNSGIGLVQCAVQPAMIAKPAGADVNVRLQECSGASCSGICSIHTVKSNACISLAESVAGGNSATFTCNGGIGQCAQMMWWQGGQWQGTFGQVCGSCTETPKGINGMNRGFLSVQCTSNGTVVRRFGCDSSCSACSQTISSTPEYSRVSLPGGTGAMLLNLGIIPCNTMRRTVYPSDNCTGTPLIDGPIAEDICNNGATLSCGKHYNIESVVRTNCSNPQQPAQNFMSGQCAPAPGPSGQPMSGVGMKLTCQHGTSTCVNFAANTNSQNPSCDREVLYSAKCGSCLTSGNPSVPMRLQCDTDKMTMSLVRCRDLYCSDCETGLGQQTYSPGSCTLAKSSSDKIPISGTFLGFTTCTVVKQEWFVGATANTTCSGDQLVSEVYSGQGVCNGDTRTQCGSFVEGVNAGLIGTNGKPTTFDLLQCKDNSCSDKCEKKFSVGTNQCIPTPTYPSKYTTYQPTGSASTIFTCPVSSACANLRIFQRTNTNYQNDSCKTTATYTPMSFDVACNTCHWTAWAGMIRVDCNLVSQTATIMHGCDATCTNCNATLGVTQRGFGNCTTSAQYQVDIINTGTYPCSIIQARGFSDSQCKQLSHTIAFPASHCQFGTIASCSSFLGSPNNGNNGNAPGSKKNVGGVIAGSIIGVAALAAIGVVFYKLKSKKNTGDSTQSQYHEEPMNAQYQAFMASEDQQGV